MIRTIDMTAPFSLKVEGVAHAIGTGGTDPTELVSAAQPVIHRPTGACNTNGIIPPSRICASCRSLGVYPPPWKIVSLSIFTSPCVVNRRTATQVTPTASTVPEWMILFP